MIAEGSRIIYSQDHGYLDNLNFFSIKMACFSSLGFTLMTNNYKFQDNIRLLGNKLMTGELQTKIIIYNNFDQVHLHLKTFYRYFTSLRLCIYCM